MTRGYFDPNTAYTTDESSDESGLQQALLAQAMGQMQGNVPTMDLAGLATTMPVDRRFQNGLPGSPGGGYDPSRWPQNSSPVPSPGLPSKGMNSIEGGAGGGVARSDVMNPGGQYMPVNAQGPSNWQSGSGGVAGNQPPRHDGSITSGRFGQMPERNSHSFEDILASMGKKRG